LRPDPVTITLTDLEGKPKDYTIRPLTLGQIRRIEPLIAAAESQIEKAIDVIGIGLSRDYPEESAAVDKIELSMADIAITMMTILSMGGFVQVPVGELQP
jgi:hypothetical protein